MSRPPRVGSKAKISDHKKTDRQCPNCGTTLERSKSWRWCPQPSCNFKPKPIK